MSAPALATPAPTQQASTPAAAAGPGAAPAAARPGAQPKAGLPVVNEATPLKSGKLQLPASAVQALKAAGGKPVAVRVSVGKYANGFVQMVQAGDDIELHGGPARIPFDHPALSGLGSLQPAVRLALKQGDVSGRLVIPGADDAHALAAKVKQHARLLGWQQLAPTMPSVASNIDGGVVNVSIPDLHVSLGAGVATGKGSFTLSEDSVSLAATASIAPRPGLSKGEIEIKRDPAGVITGAAQLGVTLGPVAGAVDATFSSVVGFHVKGTIAYKRDKFDGQVTVALTDRATAASLAKEQLPKPPAAAVPGGTAPAAASVAPQAGGGGDAAPTKPADTVVAWGDVGFRINSWLAGTAKIVVDERGRLTVVGKIAPPAEVQIMGQHNTEKALPGLEIKAIYGVPVVGNLFISGKVTLSAIGKLGPIKLYKIELNGVWSENSDIGKSFEIKGSLNASAYAGLRVRAEAAAGITVVDHDVKAGMGVNADAGIKGYVEATPIIGFREVAAADGTKAPQYYIKGTMEMAAQPVLGLSGDLFVALESPWWSPAPSKRWTWPIGSLEYPLPWQFGLAASVEHVLGSDKIPEIKLSDAAFDPAKFGTDLLDDKVPPKSGGKPDSKGAWKEGGAAAPPPAPKAAPSAGKKAAPAKGGKAKAEKPVSPAALATMKAVQTDLDQLATAGAKRPFTEAQIDKALLGLKNKHAGLKGVRATRVGPKWSITGTVNPELKGEVAADSESKDQTKKAADLAVGGPVQSKPSDKEKTADVSKPQQSKSSVPSTAVKPSSTEPATSVTGDLTKKVKPAGPGPGGGESPAAARGRQAHKDANYGPGFEKEFKLPSGKRADGINFDTREVVELKPNNPRAIRAGQKQVGVYVTELNKEYPGTKPWTARVETYDP